MTKLADNLADHIRTYEEDRAKRYEGRQYTPDVGLSFTVHLEQGKVLRIVRTDGIQAEATTDKLEEQLANGTLILTEHLVGIMARTLAGMPGLDRVSLEERSVMVRRELARQEAKQMTMLAMIGPVGCEPTLITGVPPVTRWEDT
jgi:hypothetical protein